MRNNRFLMQAGALFFVFSIYLLLFCNSRIFAAGYYNFQEYHGNRVNDGTVGTGTLQMSNNLTTVRGNFIKGNGSLGNNLVIFIDSVPGGFTSTAPFSDKGNVLETSVSGLGTSRSTATFAPSFEADYAIVLSAMNSSSALYK